MTKCFLFFFQLYKGIIKKQGLMDWKILSSSTRVECSKQSGDDGGNNSVG